MKPIFLFCYTLLLVVSVITSAKTLKIDSIFSNENEHPWLEQTLQLPKYPTTPDWIEFSVNNSYPNKAYIDAKTIQIEKDKSVRFILRQLSASGVENISYEGLLCSAYKTKIYAFADTYNKKWVKSNESDWKDQISNDALRQKLYDMICEVSYTDSNKKLVEYFRKNAPK